MDITDRFRAFLIYQIDNDKELTQISISKKTGISKNLLNDYIHKRKPLSESKRELIAEHLDWRYEKAIEFGRAILSDETSLLKENPAIQAPIISFEDKHFNVVKKFKKKDRAIRINEKLAYAEQLDEDSLDKIERQIDLELEDLEKRVGIKKKPTASGND